MKKIWCRKSRARLPLTRGSRTDMSRPGLEPGPSTWEASTLEKSHLDSLFCWLFRTSTPGRRTSSTSLNIIEKLSLKTSKAMKLSKIYSLKKSKSDEIISFTFPIINILNQKTTPRLGELASQRIWQFWAIPAAFNHCFIQKFIALLLKRWFFALKVYLKKVQAITVAKILT